MLVTVDTIVRAMNEVNGTCHFRGLSARKPFDGFSKNAVTVDYVGDPNQHANVAVNRFECSVY